MEISAPQWKALVRDIQYDSCIIFVGPEFFTTTAAGEQRTQSQRLSATLQRDAQALGIQVSDNGWYQLTRDASIGGTVEAVRQFYEDESTRRQELLGKLAKIKTHFIVSLTPDDGLEQAFKKEGYPVRSSTYVMNTAPEYVGLPSKDDPLIYKMLGDLNQRNSLILTYDDFFDYIKSTFEGTSMSPELKTIVYNSRHFLFLGMPEDDWRMHLFMRVLQQHDRKPADKFATMPGHDQQVKTSWGEQYNIKLVNKQIEDFLEELIQRCSEADLIRQASAPVIAVEFSFAYLSNLIAEDRIRTCIDELKKHLRQSKGQNLVEEFGQLILIEGQLNSWDRQVSAGALIYPQKEASLAQIRLSLQELINRLENSFSAQTPAR